MLVPFIPCCQTECDLRWGENMMTKFNVIDLPASRRTRACCNLKLAPLSLYFIMVDSKKDIGQVYVTEIEERDKFLHC